MPLRRPPFELFFVFPLFFFCAFSAPLSPSPTPPTPAPATVIFATFTPGLDYPPPTQTATPVLAIQAGLQATVSLTPFPVHINLDPEDWKNWPVLPVVAAGVSEIYALGQRLGNDPHAFSVFGDCQSESEAFWGVYDSDPGAVAALPEHLQETAGWFAGSFDRDSPTVRGGTTAGALLWNEWHQGMYGCSFAESPVACELRLHNPSFVFIHVGTHYESRNITYLRQIIDQLLAEGVVPILVAKADNRELDERVNRDYALLAEEYDLPLWNFWAAVQSLPNGGLYTRGDRPLQGDIYLTDEALQLQRFTGLQALDTVWRAVTGR
ncbi:MAG: hypothetical protein JXB85_16655 [Anaerolineales bacterium]|nr:hypothetical protein [Anaerolineales bacterium]